MSSSDEAHYSSEDEVQEIEKHEIREDLKTMTFEEIMKLKEELGAKVFIANLAMHSTFSFAEHDEHLKARHQLDATIKGQQDPRNQQCIKELSGAAASIKTEIVLEDISFTDPYVGDKNKEIYDNNYNVSYENFDLNEDCLADDDHHHKPVGRKSKIEEDRIIAETEYFREKTEFFRLQQHLTALQAKKITMEIEQMSRTASSKKDES